MHEVYNEYEQIFSSMHLLLGRVRNKLQKSELDRSNSQSIV
ncbi:hypothetical protein LPICM17_120072 [Lactococcus piscium]|nr:hypothetical protein LPICM17_120072 [Lactococcus piscium]